MPRRLPELFTGFAVIAAAVWFLIYAMAGAGKINTGGYPLVARFSSIGGLAIGADVKIGGVVVGHVASETLDPNTYAAIVRLSVNNNVQVPEDSSASVASDGLLGNSYIAIGPGGSNTMLKPGQSFQVTQSAINIEDLLGKFIFSLGNGKSDKTASGATPDGGGASDNPADVK